VIFTAHTMFVESATLLAMIISRWNGAISSDVQKPGPAAAGQHRRVTLAPRTVLLLMEQVWFRSSECREKRVSLVVYSAAVTS
jgi:hypothetical protein